MQRFGSQKANRNMKRQRKKAEKDLRENGHRSSSILLRLWQPGNLSSSGETHGFPSPSHGGFGFVMQTSHLDILSFKLLWTDLSCFYSFCFSEYISM